MQKCDTCGFRKTTTAEVRDPDTNEVIGTQTVCTNCRTVLHQFWYPEGKKKLEE